MKLSSGDEHLIRGLQAKELQAIATAILAQVAPHVAPVTSAESALKAVQFTRGQSLDYPNWMFTRRGHDLLPLFQKAFGGPKVLHAPRLLKVMRRIRLVPVELADVFDTIQAERSL